jgi:IclR family acetate operon transcriptional repressor
LFACVFTHAPVIRKSLHELLLYVPALIKAAKDLSHLIDEADGDTKTSR